MTTPTTRWTSSVRARLALAFALPLVLGLTACGSDDTTCGVTNSAQVCPCPGGASSTQTCQADGTWSICACDAVLDAGAPDTGEDDTGTDDTSSPDADADTEPEENACGGTTELTFEGLPAQPDDVCGACNDGELYCETEDTLRCSVEDGLNVCGGCEVLEHDEGESCSTCAIWACAEDGALFCDDSLCNACGGTEVLGALLGDDCGACGTVVCETLDTWMCENDGVTNACGGCEPLEGAPGDACGECGLGELACADSGETLTCDDPDPIPLWWLDSDDDGYGDGTQPSVAACARPAGYVDRPGDCDDSSPLFNPNAEELVGDNADSNCDGEELCYVDADNDGWRPEGDEVIMSLNATCADGGEASSADPVGDCDDTNRDLSPDVMEQCDLIDNDCDGMVDEGVRNACDGCTVFAEGSDVGDSCGPGSAYVCDGTDALACVIFDQCLAGTHTCDPNAICTPGDEGTTYTCICDEGYYGDGEHCYSCHDGVQNGDETDVDCGGPNCDGCGGGQACGDVMDCLGSGSVCTSGMCVMLNPVGADDSTMGDAFGRSVALHGDLALVGAPADDDQGSNSGSVYVFRRAGWVWALEAKLVASDGATSDYFGHSVALSGEVALVGAYGDDDGRGSAYIFRYDGAAWAQEAKLLASDGVGADRFGNSVALSGDVALVGAYWDDDRGSKSGSAYVFRYDEGSWVEAQKLVPSDGEEDDGFGAAVALSGDVALVSAYHDDDRGSDSGSAYVFRYDGAAWAQEAKLNASDGAANDRFGNSVALSGDVALVGAHLDDDSGSDSGSAYVFRYDGAAWAHEAKLVASDGAGADRFGYSVALSGDIALVGAYWDDDRGSNSGSAYVFRYDEGSWVEAQKLVPRDGEEDDGFGAAVALDGDAGLAGAQARDSLAGVAYFLAW